MPFARLGAVFGFLAVTLGAFGAHALRDRLGAALSQVYETGVRYQMYHALALIAVDLMRARSGAERGHGAPGGAEPAGGAAPSATAASGTTTDRIGSAEPRRARSPLEVAGTLFAAGIVLFSGSLYALALTGERAWGAITPLGGAALLAGWIAFAIGCWRAGWERR